jgi:hypothetical protein
MPPLNEISFTFVFSGYEITSTIRCQWLMSEWLNCTCRLYLLFSYFEAARSPGDTLFWNCMHSRNWKMGLNMSARSYHWRSHPMFCYKRERRSFFHARRHICRWVSANSELPLSSYNSLVELYCLWFANEHNRSCYSSPSFAIYLYAEGFPWNWVLTQNGDKLNFVSDRQRRHFFL